MTEDKLYLGDNLEVMPTFKPDSIDSIVTDPPYGISFLNKKWDINVPSIECWKECLRVLKPGAFAFIMSSARQDVFARMTYRLEDAGFNVGFSSIYWTYSTGFSKAQNISKRIDKLAGATRPVCGHYQPPDGRPRTFKNNMKLDGKNKIFKIPADVWNSNERPITAAVTEKAKEFEGAYAGFQPKPAVEIIIVAMKPRSEETYVDQVLKNGHGCTWLNDCTIPVGTGDRKGSGGEFKTVPRATQRPFQPGANRMPPDQTKGRFPTNLVSEDDVLNRGEAAKESYNRYFSLDAWFADRIKHLPIEAQKTFPWLIVPKPSQAEKEKFCENEESAPKGSGKWSYGFNSKPHLPDGGERKPVEAKNIHPTIKPIKLLSWLITLSSRSGEVILDPFLGSGSTAIAAKALGRYYRGIEINEEYYEVSRLRLNESQQRIDGY